MTSGVVKKLPDGTEYVDAGNEQADEKAWEGLRRGLAERELGENRGKA